MITQESQTVILFLAANPDGVTRLSLDKECREIREKIRSSDFPRAFQLRTEWAVRPDDLLQYLNECRPQIVHFSGHGSDSEELILHDGNDCAVPVSVEALQALFATLRDNVRLVILNACFSRPQAEAIVESIDCAIGMTRAIGDEAAIVFAASFYRALGFGRSVQNAFEQGRAALLLHGIPEETTPLLLVKSGRDADKIFLVESKKESFMGPPDTYRHASVSPENAPREVHGAQSPSTAGDLNHETTNPGGRSPRPAGGEAVAMARSLFHLGDDGPQSLFPYVPTRNQLMLFLLGWAVYPERVRIAQIETAITAPTQTLADALDEVVGSRWSVKNSDGTYSLTPAGVEDAAETVRRYKKAG